MQAETDKVAEKNYFIYSTFQPSLVKMKIINYSNGLDFSIWMMKMEILIHELLHMFEKRVFMSSVFYLKKLIVKVSIKTRETHFSPLLLLDPLLIQVLNIVVNLVLSVLILHVMMLKRKGNQLW